MFTIRNGNFNDEKYVKPYAEKLLIVEENQITPFHFHWSKDDDGIIIRGYETNGNYEKFSFFFNENQYVTDVHPFEIFTVKISDENCFKVNMLEE